MSVGPTIETSTPNGINDIILEPHDKRLTDKALGNTLHESRR
jgi:hypothetical protein